MQTVKSNCGLTIFTTDFFVTFFFCCFIGSSDEKVGVVIGTFGVFSGTKIICQFYDEWTYCMPVMMRGPTVCQL